jgi:hypothetical protein
MMRRSLVVVLLLIPLLLTGCAVRMLYNWLDWAIAWKLDDYFELTSSQSNMLDQQVTQILQWHRREALPGYVQALRSLSFDLRRPLTEPEVAAHLRTFEGLMRQLAENVKQPANRFAATLTDQQIDRFMAERWKKQLEQRKEFAQENGDKVYASFQRKLTKNLDSWLGDVEPAQQPLIAQSAQWQRQYYGTWLDYQDVWLKTLALTLAERGKPGFESGLVAVVLKGDELGDGQFKHYVADSRQRSIQWFAALSASLTDEQRQYVRRKLSELAADLDALSRP